MDDIFGKVTNPLKLVSGGNAAYGDLEENGLINFISNVLKAVTVVAGLWVFINIIIAGFTYISANQDQNKIQAAWQRIYMSLIGIIIIVGAYTLTAVISILLYGNASTILSPKLFGPESISPAGP